MRVLMTMTFATPVGKQRIRDVGSGGIWVYVTLKHVKAVQLPGVICVFETEASRIHWSPQSILPLETIQGSQAINRK